MLTPEDLGSIALIDLIISFYTILIAFGLDKAVTQFCQVWKTDSHRNTISCIKLSFFIGLVFFLLQLLLLSLYGFRGYNIYLTIALLVAWPRAISLISFCYFRINTNSKLTATMQVIQSGLTLTLSIASVFLVSKDYIGMYSGLIAAELFVAGIYIYLLRSGENGVIYNVSTFKTNEIIKFCFPYVPGEIMYSATFGVDRLIVDKYFGLDVLGYYYTAFKISRFLTDFNGAVKHAWIPLVMLVRDCTNDIKDRILRFWNVAITTYIIAAALIALGSEFILANYKSGLYYESTKYLPFFLLIAICNCMYVMLMPSYNLANLGFRLMLRNGFNLLMLIILLLISGMLDNIYAVQLAVLLINLIALADSFHVSRKCLDFIKLGSNTYLLFILFFIYCISANVLKTNVIPNTIALVIVAMGVNQLNKNLRQP